MNKKSEDGAEKSHFQRRYAVYVFLIVLLLIAFPTVVIQLLTSLYDEHIMEDVSRITKSVSRTTFTLLEETYDLDNAADVDIEQLHKVIDSLAGGGRERYTLIIDENEAILTHTGGGNIVAETLPQLDKCDEYKAAIAAVMAGEGGIRTVTIEGNDYYMGYEPIIMPGYLRPWSVVTIQNRDVAMSAVTELTWRIILIVVLVFAVFTALVIVFYTSLRSTLNHLSKARNEAELSSRAKSNFLANMSHEVRTPMNAILGITEIELQRGTLPTETSKALEKIHESGDLLLNIINDILDLSKIEAGKMTIRPVKYDVPGLISDAVQLNRLRFENKPIEFKLEIDERMPLKLYGDVLRIKQILNNILSNAFKYTDAGSVKLEVMIEESEGKYAGVEAVVLGGAGEMRPVVPEVGEYAALPAVQEVVRNEDSEVTIIFRVSDTGKGMTLEQQGELFTEYTRFNVEANRTTVGTGLGMSITKRLLGLMNGEIRVESEPFQGSVFTVRLPQKRVDNVVCGANIAKQLSELRFQNKSKLKRLRMLREHMPYGSVLVVDDVESNIYVTKGMLTTYSLQVDTAKSGFEAIEKIRKGVVYDIIFMDHMMPEMDGIEATKRLRKMGYTGYIVALTANALVGQAEMFMRNGFDSFISKPIDTRELNQILNDFIRDQKPPEVVKAARRERYKKVNSGEAVFEKHKAEMQELFTQDAIAAITALNEICAKLEAGENFLEEKDMMSYEVTVHGMKSALLHVDEKEKSEIAFELEKACKAGNVAVMREETPAFVEMLKDLVDEFGAEGM